MKKYLLTGVLVLLFAMPLAAAQKGSVKIKLPDGVYMYDSEVQRQKDGTDRVGFGKFFVVHKNNIYSSKDFAKKFGISKLNELFGGFFGLKEDKKYKILCGGEVVGKYFNLRFDKDDIDDDADVNCDELFFTKDIKEGPAYGKGRLGSAAKCIAVPEEYKEVMKKVYTTIPQEEVDKIEKLAKENLFDLVKNRKEMKKYKIIGRKLDEEKVLLLDKMSDSNGDFYIGLYWNLFPRLNNTGCVFETIFFIRNEHLGFITNQFDDETLFNGDMRIMGMLDIDGCGQEELIIEKLYPSEDGPTVYLEIYKQQANGTWALIEKIKTS